MSITWVDAAPCLHITADYIAKAIGKPHATKPRAYKVAAYADGSYAVIPDGKGRQLKPRNVIGTYAPSPNLNALSAQIVEDMQC